MYSTVHNHSCYSPLRRRYKSKTFINPNYSFNTSAKALNSLLAIITITADVILNYYTRDAKIHFFLVSNSILLKSALGCISSTQEIYMRESQLGRRRKKKPFTEVETLNQSTMLLAGCWVIILEVFCQNIFILLHTPVEKY